MEELNEAISSAKAGKAPGLDQVPAEAWAALSEGRHLLLKFFQRCWMEENFPREWRRAMVVGIFKKGAADAPANYRPISLLQTAYKLYGRILATRLQKSLDRALRNTQFGFRRGRSTAEPIFIVRRIQDLIYGRQNQALHLLFLDWAKAFDRVDTACLRTVLGRYGIPAKVCNVVCALVSEPVFQVSMSGSRSREWAQEVGIRQGCTLSPFLFTLILSAIMHDAVGRIRRQSPLATTPVIPVLDIEYADDTVLIARMAEVATKLLEQVQVEAGKCGLRVNKAKTCRIACDSQDVV